MELACAFGALPHEVARWPWRRVQRCWTTLRRKQRREQRERIFLAHQSGMGALGQALGGGAPAAVDEDAERLRQMRSMGLPVKVVKAEG